MGWPALPGYDALDVGADGIELDGWTVVQGAGIRSSKWQAGSAGWMIEGNGNAEFNNVTVRGTIYATSGEISGTLTMTGGGAIRTGTSGNYIELKSAGSNQLIFYGNKTNFGKIEVAADVIEIRTPYGTGYDPAMLYLVGEQAAGGFAYAQFEAGSGLYSFYENEAQFYPLGTSRMTVGAYGVRITDGSAATPSISFTGDPDTGFYRAAGNRLDVAAAGLKSMGWGHNGSTRGQSFYYGNDSDGIHEFYLGGSGGEHRFLLGQKSTGMLTFYGTDGGTPTVRISPSVSAGKVHVPGGNLGYLAASGGEAAFVVSSATTTINNTQPGLYMGFDSSNNAGWIDSVTPGTSVRRLLLNPQGGPVESQGIYNNTTASAANVHISGAGTGVLQRSTSSRRYKDKITPAWSLADIDLTPVRFWSLTDERWQFGFIAEDVADAIPEAAELNGDGEVENYDLRSVVAVLAAKVARLEKQAGM
jgi:hypothetical protein